MQKNYLVSKKNSLFIFFAIVTSMQSSHSSIIKYVLWGTVAHISGLYKAYKHAYYNNDKNVSQQEDEKNSFIVFAKNIICEYPFIKDVVASDEFKKALENVKKVNS